MTALPPLLRPRILICLAALVACSPRPSDMTESTDLSPFRSPAEPTPAPASPDHAAIFATSDLPAEMPTPLADDPLGVTVHRLRNGLTVFLSVDREQPRVQSLRAARSGGGAC